MKPASKKQKGSRLEREWAELLRGYDIDKNAKRMPLSGAFNDPRMKADIITDLPIHFEVKNQENWSPLDYFKQASSTCGAKIPVVVMSRNREQIYCFMLGSDFLTILNCAIKGGWSYMPIIKKPIKQKKTDLTVGLPYSKSKQLHKILS